MPQPICLLTDYGLADEFVGVLHGVILRISPQSPIVDITHGIPPGDIRAGALALTRAVQYLPAGVVLAVVDPGVGTARRALAIGTDSGYFVGPDNGLLSPAVAMIGGARSIYSIENPDVIIPGPGATFHGRDVFAPAAALLAAGEAKLEDLGPAVNSDEVTPLMLPLPKVDPPAVTGEAWWVDVYGNVETNIGPEELELAGARRGDELEVRVGATMHRVRWAGAFADVGPNEALVHVDSAGLIALAINGGRADEELNLTTGMAVTFRAT
ncbi:MAG TPA: SAM-dependent chlorinase/fluorinase [Acidimicrobiia bacterium]